MICFRSFENRASSISPFRDFFSSFDMIFQTWRSILRSSASSDHFGPRLRSSSERRSLIDSSTSFPIRYSSTGSEPRLRAESKKILTIIFENRRTDSRRSSQLPVGLSRPSETSVEAIASNRAIYPKQNYYRELCSETTSPANGTSLHLHQTTRDRQITEEFPA